MMRTPGARLVKYNFCGPNLHKFPIIPTELIYVNSGMSPTWMSESLISSHPTAKRDMRQKSILTQYQPRQRAIY